MTENQPSVPSFSIKYGLAGGVIAVLYSAVIMVMDLSTNKVLGLGTYLILIGAIIIAINQYKKANNGYISYGQGIGLGTLVSTVIGLLAGLFISIYTTFIDPLHFEKIFDQQRMELEERGMSDEQIDTALSIGESMNGPVMTIVMSLIGYAIIGLILSLIIAAIMKKRRSEFE